MRRSSNNNAFRSELISSEHWFNVRVFFCFFFPECREYYSLTTRGGGTIDAGGCRKKKDGNNHGKNRLTIVGGSEAGEGEFPHMVRSANALIVTLMLGKNELKSVWHPLQKSISKSFVFENNARFEERQKRRFQTDNRCSNSASRALIIEGFRARTRWVHFFRKPIFSRHTLFVEKKDFLGINPIADDKITITRNFSF